MLSMDIWYSLAARFVIETNNSKSLFFWRNHYIRVWYCVIPSDNLNRNSKYANGSQQLIKIIIIDYLPQVGSQATDFAVQMGFPVESLATPTSEKMHQNWLKKKCQPNFWTNVKPNPQESCGPYTPGKCLNSVCNFSWIIKQ